MDTPPVSDGSERSQTVSTERRQTTPRRVDPTELLSRLWQQNLPVMRERVASLERASQAAMAGELSEPDRTAASDLAHKLAGSLGMFGYPQGTELAREMEHLLEAPSELDAARLVQLSVQLRAVLPL